MCKVKDHRTSCGNPDFYKKCLPADDHAPFLKKILEAGATLKGISICDEFFYSLIGENGHYGTPTNLNAPGCVPGGSSSGSAAALTTNLYDFSIGSDTGGSVRVPASFCGLFGIRPTHSRINTEGVYPMAPSFDTLGWFAKDINIFKKIGSILLNPNKKTEFSFKEFVIAEDIIELANPEIIKLFNNYINDKFPEIKKIRLSKYNKEEIADNFRILQGGEIQKNIIPWILENKPKISPEINNRIEMAMKITTDEINKAQKFRENLKVEVDKSLTKGIIALFPTTPFSSLKCGQSDEQLASYRKKLMEFTSIAGMTSRPQISMPKFKDNTGPIGISLLGWRYSDEVLLEKLTYL
jgi:amidase